jgi:CubicO group peptidase (beta-lactamase class C family)
MISRRECFLTAFASAIGSAAVQKSKLDEAVALIESSTVRAAALEVTRGGFRLARAFGAARPDTLFLLASISKPMTATAVMRLADKGSLSLSDPVHKFIPEFTGGDRDLITIRHLLTHTSGLPDMLPNNDALRARHAPLNAFVAGVCQVPLLFKPGTQVRYQSMGILLAAEIVERITQTPLREYLRREVFGPLGMESTALGLGGHKLADMAQGEVTGNDSWNWNSPYWRDLGAPWGGVHSTTGDVTRFLRSFLHPDGRVLKRETATLMTRNQNAGLNTPWGLGWMVKPGDFGKACSNRTFGHYGSTGTCAWADPETNLTCVLLTTRPADQSRSHLLGPVSDLVAESV